ncbi:MAG: peroxiredoxin family protein [Nitrospinota bacterium]|nr:peroxiredoxin family protein [Nitrospinota bacterium]
MSFARSISYIFLLSIASCGNIIDDLSPSGEDKRASIEIGTEGFGVGQLAPDFTVSDSLGNEVTLSSALTGSKGIVFYFTMWCPYCDSHQENMQSYVIPDFSPDIKFYLVDYVNDSVENCRASQVSNGYGNAPFTVLADTQQKILTSFKATMGTTIVIDSGGTVLMNEEYKKTKLLEILGGLQ